MAIKTYSLIWDNYWNIFNSVCNSLSLRNQNIIVENLKEAQLHVNGLTDGWHEFYNHLDAVIDDNVEIFTSNELLDLTDLRNCLYSVLNNR